MNGGELTGRAASLYRCWRDLGLTESQAMTEVERAGLVAARPDRLKAAFVGMGLSESAAGRAAAGRAGEAPRPPHLDAEFAEAWEAAVVTAAGLHHLTDSAARTHLVRLAEAAGASVRTRGEFLEALRTYTQILRGVPSAGASAPVETATQGPRRGGKVIELRENRRDW